MKKIFLFVLLISLLTVSFATAEIYVSGSAGLTFLDDSDLDDGYDTGKLSYDFGLGIVGAFGATVMDNGRAEIELGFRNSDMDEITLDGYGTAPVDGDMSALSVMLNAYYDFANDSDFVPFVGAGIGIASIDMEIESGYYSYSTDDNVFAYQGMIGCGYDVNESFVLDLQYRYFATEDPSLGGVDTEYKSHNVLFGIRYYF